MHPLPPIDACHHFYWGYHYRTVTSTNDVALDYVANHISTGPTMGAGVVVADYQTAGRGRGTHTWQSPRGQDILMSMVIWPTVDHSNWGRVFMAMAIHIRHGLADGTIPGAVFTLKWPNDLFLNGKKCGGMLSSAHRRWGCMIVGVGINVNQSCMNADRVSLAQMNGTTVDRNQVLAHILQSVDHHMMAIQSGEFDPLEWDRHAQYMNRCVTIMHGTRRIKGVLQGINTMGHLILRCGQSMVTVEHGDQLRLCEPL